MSCATHDGLSWPDAGWGMPPSSLPEGWNPEALCRAWDYANTINSDAIMLVQNGRTVATYGDMTTRYMCHSIRKSFLSALMGRHVDAGTIDLAATLADLDIDDTEGLSGREKQATVYDLLTARSGIFHPAGYETAWMRSIKELRHSHAPGTFWCYSNWDFNALGTIFEKLTGLGIHEDFRDSIARSIGMEDFRFDEERKDGSYSYDDCSIHRAYPFRMSTRDMARFGLLFLRRGQWNGKQVLSRDWVDESVLPYSNAGPRGSYGYMWWVARDGIGFPGVITPEGSYSARGAGGHYCMVIPPLDLVVVHRVNTDIEDRQVDGFKFGRLLKLILASYKA